MSYRFLPALMIIVGLVTLAGAVPAAARVRPPPQVVSERNAATPVVVERIEIGRLGVAAPPVVRERRLHDIVGVASRRFTLMPKAFSIQSHVESCYYAKPSWRRYNGFGKLASKAWYYIEWCGKDNKVTRVLTLYCGGVASQGFSYDGCKVRRGSTGYSRLAVSGSWKFPFRVGAYTFLTRTVTVSARHYGTGRYAGTWRMYH